MKTTHPVEHEALILRNENEDNLVAFYNAYIRDHSTEEYAFGLDCEAEILDAEWQFISDAMDNNPDMAHETPYAPALGFDPDAIIKMIAQRDYIPAQAVYDALKLVDNVEEYKLMLNEAHPDCYSTVILY